MLGDTGFLSSLADDKSGRTPDGAGIIFFEKPSFIDTQVLSQQSPLFFSRLAVAMNDLAQHRVGQTKLLGETVLMDARFEDLQF